MGQGTSTPKTIKTYSYSIKSNEYSSINDTNLLKPIRCNYYTAKEYQDIDKNLLPKHMCKIRKTVNIGNTKITDQNTRKKILKTLKYDTDEHDDTIEMYQFTMNKAQLRKLEETIDNILDSFSKSVKGGKIPEPIYVAYSKILDYNGSYLTRYCDIVKNDKNENKRRFFTDLSNQLKNNKKIVDNTISTRYVWKGNIDLIILIPNMNNSNRIHTNMFDYYIHNEITNYLVNHNFMNNIIPNDTSIYPTFLQKKIHKQYNFEHDSNNICTFHGCTSTGDNQEDLDAILPPYTKDDSTMRANTKLTKVYLPSKCLRPVDYVKNGYNPEGKNVRKKINFDINVDYTDIVFEMIFCLAIDCMFKNADKDNGVARRWNNYIDKFRRDPNSLEENELCDDHIIKHMNSYVYECIKGTPEDEDEDAVQLDLKPIKIKKDHYTKWNNDIMKELAKRKTQFPGVQQYIYPFFQLVTNKSKIHNKVFNLPWGDRLLTNKEFLAEGDFKTEIKSHNNSYSLFTNQYGQFGIKKDNKVIKWFSNFRFPKEKYGIKLRTDCKITVDSGTSTIIILTITEQKNFKLPLSLIVNNNGTITIYENGFKPISLIKNFKVSTSSTIDDIEQINKDGLWNYLSGKNTDNKQNKQNKQNNNQNNQGYQGSSSKYAKCEWITTEIEQFTNKQCDNQGTEKLNEIVANNRILSDNSILIEKKTYYTNGKRKYENCKWNNNEIIQ
jgi:hypothetical protein